MKELLYKKSEAVAALNRVDGFHPMELARKIGEEGQEEQLYLDTLRDEERKLIYQHVFEERTFEEMSRLNGLSEERCKGIYYYAIRKIRKVMGGEN